MTYFKQIKIVDDDGFPAVVTSDGRLSVTPDNPEYEDAIDVSQEETFHIEGHQYMYSTYVIPTDSTSNELMITKMRVGGAPGNARLELYYSASGVIDGNEEMLQAFYTNTGNTEVYDLDIRYTGDGTNAIICKMVNLDFGHRYLYFKWEGKLK